MPRVHEDRATKRFVSSFDIMFLSMQPRLIDRFVEGVIADVGGGGEISGTS